MTKKKLKVAPNITLVMEIRCFQHLQYKLNYKQIITGIKMKIYVNGATKIKKTFRHS